MTKYLIAVVGPTAIGKTILSIQLAKHYQTEIISADSRQFYKEMNIGTAVPSEAELNSVQHHFIQHKSITEDYSVGAYERDAIKKLDALFSRKDVVILVGGSGLYVDAVVHGLDDFPDIDSTIRAQLISIHQTKGLKPLQDQLKQLDPETYKTIAIDNPHRVIRALEICIGTGQPYASFLNKKKSKRSFKTIYVGLTAERAVIYERINQRVDLMMAAGLLDEAKALLPYKDLNALNTVGYKELFKFLEDQWSLETAVEEIKKNTRRFAKRQLTWFRKNEAILWFDYTTNTQAIIEELNLK